MFRKMRLRRGALGLMAAVLLLWVAACSPIPLPGSAEGLPTLVATIDATATRLLPLIPTATLQPSATSTQASPSPTATSTATALPATATVSPTSTATETVAPGPTVRLTYPGSNAQVNAGEPITIQSVAEAVAGVARVELWVDGALYASAANVSSASTQLVTSQVWSSTASGYHTLTVWAYDALGRVSPAASVVIRVVTTSAAPTVWLIEPDTDDGRIVVQSGDDVSLEYWATAEAGVAYVELWADSQLYAVDTNPDSSTILYGQRTWSSTDYGDHSLVLRVYDVQGQSSDSALLVVGVTDRDPPVINLTYPGNGAQLPTGQTVPVTVSASDSKGITHVELYVDGQLYSGWNSTSSVGETPAQIELAWQNPAVGSHSLYAVAFDSVGQSTSTDVATVDVVAAPTATPAPSETPTAAPTAAPTETVVPPTATSTPIAPTETPTPSPTPTDTPMETAAPAGH